MKINIRKAGITVVGAASLIASLGLATGSAFAAPHHAVSTTVSAHPANVPADGKSTSKITVKVHGAKSDAATAVTLAAVATPTGACGTLTASTGTTGKNKMFSTTYTASSVIGFCSITATGGAATGSVTITQIDPVLALALTHYTVTVATKPTKVAANGTSTATLTATVMNGTTAVSGDAVSVTERALKPGACGTFVLSAGTTDANGQVSITYTSSTKSGNCKINVEEAATASHASLVVHQTK